MRTRVESFPPPPWSSSNNLDQRGTPAVVPRCSSPLCSTLRVSCWASEQPSGMSRHSWQPKMEVTDLKMCKVFNKTAHISIPNSHLTQLSVNMSAIQSQPPNSRTDAETLNLLQRSSAEERRCRFRVLETCVPSCHYSIPAFIRKSDLCFAPSTLSGGDYHHIRGGLFFWRELFLCSLLRCLTAIGTRVFCFVFFSKMALTATGVKKKKGGGCKWPEGASALCGLHISASDESESK